jgi:hypothetical protein
MSIFPSFFFLRKRTLPSLKLIALDISELHNQKKEIEVFSLRRGLEGKKKLMWFELKAEKPMEFYKLKLSKKTRKKILSSG